MSIDWDWGYSSKKPLLEIPTYLGWLISGFQVTVALSLLCLDHRFFIVGSFLVFLQTVALIACSLV